MRELEVVIDNKGKGRVWAAVFFWVLIALSACLLGSAFALSFKLWHAEPMGYIRLVQATFLAYGLGIGLFGSAVALYAPENQRRFGTATTIHGFGFVMLSFAAGQTLEQRLLGYGLPIVPLLIPAAIVGLSFVMFVKGWLARPPRKENGDDSRAELPPPLFPP